MISIYYASYTYFKQSGLLRIFKSRALALFMLIYTRLMSDDAFICTCNIVYVRKRGHCTMLQSCVAGPKQDAS